MAGCQPIRTPISTNQPSCYWSPPFLFAFFTCLLTFFPYLFRNARILALQSPHCGVNSLHSFTRLKHVFHTGGCNIWSILSIKVHLILSLSSSIREKNGLFWEFCPWGGGGPLFPKVNVKIVTKYQLFLVKTKNDPYPYFTLLWEDIFFYPKLSLFPLN